MEVTWYWDTKTLIEAVKPRQVLQIVTVPITDFCCNALIILLDSLPVKPRRLITYSGQVGIESNVSTMMGMNSNL